MAAMLLGVGRFAVAAKLQGGVTTARSEGSEPINVTGHETIYDSKEDTFTVIGNAVMTQGGSVLKADQIKLYRQQAGVGLKEALDAVEGLAMLALTSIEEVRAAKEEFRMLIEQNPESPD